MPADTWCRCGRKGTCIGCLIEKKVFLAFGHSGLAHLERYLAFAAGNQPPESYQSKLKRCADELHPLQMGSTKDV